MVPKFSRAHAHARHPSAGSCGIGSDFEDVFFPPHLGGGQAGGASLLQQVCVQMHHYQAGWAPESAPPSPPHPRPRPRSWRPLLARCHSVSGSPAHVLVSPPPPQHTAQRTPVTLYKPGPGQSGGVGDANLELRLSGGAALPLGADGGGGPPDNTPNTQGRDLGRRPRACGDSQADGS